METIEEKIRRDAENEAYNLFINFRDKLLKLLKEIGIELDNGAMIGFGLHGFKENREMHKSLQSLLNALHEGRNGTVVPKYLVDLVFDLKLEGFYDTVKKMSLTDKKVNGHA